MKTSKKENSKTKSWLIWKYLFRPLVELFKEYNRSATVLWFVFTIFAAQIGPLVNIIKHAIFHDGCGVTGDTSFWTAVQESLCLDSRYGSFYTFSIVLIASVLSPLFIGLIEEHEIHFKKMKIFAVVVAIFTLFFGGVFYSFSTLNVNTYDFLKNATFSVDKSQTFFFILAILVALYAFGLTRMNKENNKDIDDYLGDERKRQAQLTDATGIKTIGEIKLINDEK